MSVESMYESVAEDKARMVALQKIRLLPSATGISFFLSL